MAPPPNRSRPGPSRLNRLSVAATRKPAGPRLPGHLQRKVLLAFFSNLREKGTADVIAKVALLPPLSLVCRNWERFTSPEYCNWLQLDLREQNGLEDGGTERIEAEALRRGVANQVLSQSSGPYSGTGGALKLWIDDISPDEWRAVCDQAMTDVRAHLGGLTQLDLCLDGEQAGRYIQMCVHFSGELWPCLQLSPGRSSQPLTCSKSPTELNKLLIVSKELSCPVIFTPVYFSSTLSVTLTRLDLVQITIHDWQFSLPALRTLTLCFVSFESHRHSSADNGTLEEEEDSISASSNEPLCRRFFDSVPNLRSLGIEGTENLDPSSLSRLRVFSVTRLYVADLTLVNADAQRLSHSGNRPFHSIAPVPALSRYFHCQVKRLFFSPRHNSLPLLRNLLTSRQNKSCPPFLKRLETIRLAPPSFDEDLLLQQWKKKKERKVRAWLRTAKLENVQVSWWESEYDEPVHRWEPTE